MPTKISLLHPSYKRPQLALDCYNLWMNNAEDKESIEYILCLAADDPTYQQYRDLFAGTKAIVVSEQTNGLINQVNRAAKYAMGNLLIAVSDDFGCEEKWDTSLLAALEGKEDFLVKTNDGLQPWIITLPLMDRKYYSGRKYIYHPSTLHMFCDTYITHEAHLMGKVVTIPLKFPHNHYATGRTPKDEVNVQNDSTWIAGEAVYLEGVRNNFWIENPLPVQLPADIRRFLQGKGIVV